LPSVAGAALLVVVGTLADIVLTMLPGWEATTVPGAIEAWFAQLQNNPLLGLRNLDLLNVTMSVAGLPLYVALYGVHRRTSQGMAALALVAMTLGTAVFVANNAALPMLTLAERYGAAATDVQRLALLGAGEALLAQSAHGAMGAFPGFFLSSLGTLLMTLAMATGEIFPRGTTYTGMIGIMLLFAYIVGVTFVAEPGGLLLAVAAVGGLLMIVWHGLVARQLLRLGK
jgi:hypothetical protein